MRNSLIQNIDSKVFSHRVVFCLINLDFLNIALYIHTYFCIVTIHNKVYKVESS